MISITCIICTYQSKYTLKVSSGNAKIFFLGKGMLMMIYILRFVVMMIYLKRNCWRRMFFPFYFHSNAYIRKESYDISSCTKSKTLALKLLLFFILFYYFFFIKNLTRFIGDLNRVASFTLSFSYFFLSLISFLSSLPFF